ncbi:hypothetical protein FPFC_022140 [Fructobacillus pseudoficulneus]|uniref:Uncharacterized protein n=2 Tax=Fructobacillus pseudoficulneus TaxID=220714 RepID=A0A3F3GTG1_9LACO|nr:hypothetical protein [Fructobacillus pseudoficulneus]GAP02764.1 hypothetical protein FPFC_022140 [Fructobacillus pseudoficulneus]SEH39718.1 hypothetical protein SAMN05660469_0702 [Fructobacillus pseudoficulneus]
MKTITKQFALATLVYLFLFLIDNLVELLLIQEAGEKTTLTAVKMLTVMQDGVLYTNFSGHLGIIVTYALFLFLWGFIYYRFIYKHDAFPFENLLFWR